MPLIFFSVFFYAQVAKGAPSTTIPQPTVGTPTTAIPQPMQNAPTPQTPAIPNAPTVQGPLEQAATNTPTTTTTATTTTSSSDDGTCDGPFEKTGQVIVKAIGGGMTVFFALINEELNATSDINDGSLRSVWVNVRNLSLGLITLALIIIAFANLLNIDIEKYGANRMIPKLLIAIVMSYFSFTIAMVMLEMANGLQALVLTTMAKNTTNLNDLNPAANMDTSCTGPIMGVVGVLLAVIVLILAFICFLYLLIVLIVRKVVIFFLVAVSPLAFMMNVLPFTASLYSGWWKRFSSWVFMGPVIMFVLYLGVTFMTVGAGSLEGGDFVIQVLMSGISVAIAAMVPNMMGKEVYGGIANAWKKHGEKIPGVKLGKKTWENAKNARENYGNSIRSRQAQKILNAVGDKGGYLGGVATGKRGIFNEDFMAGKAAYNDAFKDAELSTLQTRLDAKTNKGASVNHEDAETVALMETIAKNHHQVTWSDSARKSILTAKEIYEGSPDGSNAKKNLAGVNSGIATNADKDALTNIYAKGMDKIGSDGKVESGYLHEVTRAVAKATSAEIARTARGEIENAIAKKIKTKSTLEHTENDAKVIATLQHTNKVAKEVAEDVKRTVKTEAYNRASTGTKEAHKKYFPEASSERGPSAPQGSPGSNWGDEPRSRFDG